MFGIDKFTALPHIDLVNIIALKLFHLCLICLGFHD